MGTVFSFDVRYPSETSWRLDAESLAPVLARLHHLDAVFSTYRRGSAISRLARGEVSVADCPPEVAEVLRLCENAARQTGGWFSATAGGTLDPSGVVKGWAVQQASEMLSAAGNPATLSTAVATFRARAARFVSVSATRRTAIGSSPLSPGTTSPSRPPDAPNAGRTSWIRSPAVRRQHCAASALSARR